MGTGAPSRPLRSVRRRALPPIPDGVPTFLLGDEQPGNPGQGNEQHSSPDPSLTGRHQVETSCDNRDDDQETAAQPQYFEPGAGGQRTGLKVPPMVRLFLHLLQETLWNVTLNRLVGRQNVPEEVSDKRRLAIW